MASYLPLVEYVVKQLVTEPDAVVVKEVPREDGGVSVRISVASGDVGRIIGKKGATINALRQLTRASAAKAWDTVDVDVVEES